MRARQINAYAIQRPDLDYAVIGSVARGQLCRDGILHGLVAKDECGLAQVVVEERIRLVKGVAINN